MDYDQLFEEFNVGAVRQICLGSEVRSRTEHELELKEKLWAKYDARGVLLGEKDAEIARLKSLVKEKETESREGEFYPAYLTTLAGRRWLLTHGVELAMTKYLKSPEYQGILGHALGRAVDYGMQEGLAAGHEHGVAGTPLSAVVTYNLEAAESNYLDAYESSLKNGFILVHLFEVQERFRMDEVLDCFLLDGPLADLPEAAHLQPCFEQLSVHIYHADVNAVAGETSLSFALLNVYWVRLALLRLPPALRIWIRMKIWGAWFYYAQT
ncbi:hypothetical protein Tco_1453062 [Tanacetum coccineum]